MELKTATPLDQVLKQGFKGKAVELVSTYSHRSTLLKMREEIECKLKLTSGPLYMGEAEYLLLLPLCEAVRAANQDQYRAEVPRHAYQLAAAYAMVFDISKISQSKDIANQITLNSITAQPIIQAFMGRVESAQRSKSDRGSSGSYKDQISEIWDIISTMMTSVVYTPTNRASEKNTPLNVVYEATSSGISSQDLESNAVNVWNTLLGQLRHGKGTPLDKEGRRAYMALMSELLMRIDLLIDAAKTDVVVDYTDAQNAMLEGEKIPEMRTSFVDAYTAMYWLQMYLRAIDQYDVIFPATDLLVQSQAWVLVIKTQSAKFKKAYLDIAQVAISYDVFTAMQMWEEVRKFYDPVLNHSHSAVADMDAIWSDNVAKADKLLSSYAKSQTSSLVSSFKSYMEADYLLPEEEFHAASDIVDLFEFPSESNDVYSIPTGRDALLQLDSVGERQVSLLDRDLLVPGLAKSAGAVETALAYVKRSREILRLSDETDDIYHALLPEGISWTDPYALEGKVGQMQVADFRFKDPMQLCYEKYKVTNTGTAIGSLDWMFTPLLMKPFYRVPQLLKFSQNRTPESRVLWPGMGDLPVGDVITAQYVAQPLPACYTASRNANFVNNDFSAYLTLMSGKSGVTSSSRDMFRKLAAVLDKFEGTYARGILDALAATMFVYRAKSGDDYQVMKPSLPTIYGMPTQAMLQRNEVKPSTAREDVVMRRSIRIALENGTTYLFVLHAFMPKPERMVYISYPYTKGVYVHVPLLSSIFEKNRDELAATMHVTFDSKSKSSVGNSSLGGYELQELCDKVYQISEKKLGSAKFIPTLGWAPYLVNLPHMMCTYQDEDDVLLEEAYKKYALLSVRVRYDEVERAVYIGGFKENPAVLLDVEDYSSAINAEDPSPLPPSPITDVPAVDPETPEPARSAAEPAPKPDRLAPVPADKSAKLDDLARVTKAPVPDPEGGDGDGLTNVTSTSIPRGAKITTAPADSGAAAGDPVADSTKENDSEETKSKEKYWKKIDEAGNTIDVVKAVDCPDGYVPASEAEYRTFVIETTKQATEAKEA